jgi:scyllo-inositol 2-dehydrogenase (NAD+)
MARLNAGLIGLGRLGRVYARDLSSRIAQTRLAAVADTNGVLAREVAAQFDIPQAYDEPARLIADPGVDAIVIVSPTHTHRDMVNAALASRKPTFCEKPPALSLAEAIDMAAAEERTGTFLQMGFMRRFDPGYAAAKRQIDNGRIGRPMVFKATSRDPFPPSLAYADPKSSGGIFIDMGIHDFDLGRWFMGEIDTVQAAGAVLAFPELATVGDRDNVIAMLTFASGCLGVVDLTRSGVYGYDITTELLGTEGTIRVGYLRETPILLMTRNTVAHDTVPYFMERFERAYTLQLENFADNVLRDRPAPITIQDGVEALRVAVAATRACETGQRVDVRTVVPERL